MSATRTYLDHNATSPLRPEARAAVLEALERGGNGSSVHAEGRWARGVIEDARASVAALIGARSDMVTFTSGGTEANNAVILGAPVERIIISAIEHPSVMEPARARGLPLSVVGVTDQGVIDLDQLSAALAEPGRALVAVMAANNETGVIQPLDRISALAREHGALVHVDAIQAAGRLPLAWPLLDIDSMALSGHKLGAPAGIGALVTAPHLDLAAQMLGGGQEQRRRAGTENLSGIAGMGAAARAAQTQLIGERARLGALRDRFEQRLTEIAPGAVVFGQGAERLGNTSCFALPGLTAQLLVISLDLEGIAVSSGSACSSGKVARSHVLEAMGVDADLAAGAIRVSLGWTTTEHDMDRLLGSLATIIERKRARRAA